MSPARSLLRVASLVFLAALVVAGPGGCHRSTATEGENASGSARPAVLRLGWVPSDEDLERRTRFEGLCQHLSRRLGLPVQLIETGTYSTAIEAMRAGKVDVVTLGPFAYLIGHEKAGAEAIIAPGTPAGAVNTYRSSIVVRADSSLRTMDDVKAHARELTLAWVDPASASGHLVPRSYLESIGIRPDTAFKSTIFTLSHLTSALTVRAGKVDLAVLSVTTHESLVKKGRLGAGELRTLWTSEPIPISVTAVRGALSAPFKHEVQAAFLAFRTEAPADWEAFHRLFVDPATIWVAATDHDYEPLRAMARSVPNMELLEK